MEQEFITKYGYKPEVKIKTWLFSVKI
jgi:hypothetical protein